MNIRERSGVARFVTDAKFRKAVVDEAHRVGYGRNLGTGVGDILKWLEIAEQIMQIIRELLKKKPA